MIMTQTANKSGPQKINNIKSFDRFFNMGMNFKEWLSFQGSLSMYIVLNESTFSSVLEILGETANYYILEPIYAIQTRQSLCSSSHDLYLKSTHNTILSVIEKNSVKFSSQSLTCKFVVCHLVIVEFHTIQEARSS